MKQENYYKWGMAGAMVQELDAARAIVNDQIEQAGSPDSKVTPEALEILKSTLATIDERKNIVFTEKVKLENDEFKFI